MNKIEEFTTVCVNCYEDVDVLTIGVGNNVYDPIIF